MALIVWLVVVVVAAETVVVAVPVAEAVVVAVAVAAAVDFAVVVVAVVDTAAGGVAADVEAVAEVIVAFVDFDIVVGNIIGEVEHMFVDIEDLHVDSLHNTVPQTIGCMLPAIDLELGCLSAGEHIADAGTEKCEPIPAVHTLRYHL